VGSAAAFQRAAAWFFGGRSLSRAIILFCGNAWFWKGKGNEAWTGTAEIAAQSLGHGEWLSNALPGGGQRTTANSYGPRADSLGELPAAGGGGTTRWLRGVHTGFTGLWRQRKAEAGAEHSGDGGDIDRVDGRSRVGTCVFAWKFAGLPYGRNGGGCSPGARGRDNIGVAGWRLGRTQHTAACAAGINWLYARTPILLGNCVPGFPEGRTETHAIDATQLAAMPAGTLASTSEGSGTGYPGWAWSDCAHVVGWPSGSAVAAGPGRGDPGGGACAKL